MGELSLMGYKHVLALPVIPCPLGMLAAGIAKLRRHPRGVVVEGGWQNIGRPTCLVLLSMFAYGEGGCNQSTRFCSSLWYSAEDCFWWSMCFQILASPLNANGSAHTVSQSSLAL